jgi:two-component system, OmpR family, phosphate regulon sensor histidine kinase PhoR
MTGNLVHRGVALGVGAVVVTFILLILSDVIEFTTTGWLVTLIAVVMAGMLGFLFFATPQKAIEGVSSAANALAQGRLDQGVPITSGPTSELTRNFNQMAGRVQHLFASTEAGRARLEAVLDASTDAIIALAEDTGVRFLNPAALRLLRMSYESAINRPFIESARDYELDALVRRALAKRGTGETAVITFGPQRTPLRAVAVPIRDGGDWAVLLMLNDLTEVQRIDHVRRDFLSNVSHELRTPLASIRALVETLEEGAVDGKEETDEFIRRILQQVDRLTALVNELLDLSRIESGAVELRPEEFDLAEVAVEAASLLRPRLEAAQVTVDCPEPCGVRVEADRGSVLRVVSNLLDNAIKYSPPGSRIHVELRDEGELASLSVRDEGPGIAPSDLPRVFERFYKGDTSRAETGVGLGLAIVKHLVRAHGGTAGVSSPAGSGAVFTVRLPRKFVGSRPAALR